jgi:hypothetical protein
LFKLVVLDQEVLAEGALLLWVVDHELVVTGKEDAGEDEEVEMADVVGREVG